MTENKIFRKLLWIRHGCPTECLYGDDGELQCNCCLIDFKRDLAEEIQQRFFDINVKKLANENNKNTGSG